MAEIYRCDKCGSLSTWLAKIDVDTVKCRCGHTYKITDKTIRRTDEPSKVSTSENV